MKKLLFLYFYLLPAMVFSQAGNSGMKFLTLNNSRVSALGESYITFSNNASGSIGNPAGMINDEKTYLELGIRNYIQDISSQSLMGKFNISSNLTLGIHILNMKIPDIEVRTKPGDAEGLFSSQDISAGFSFAYKLDDNYHLGITFKYLFEKLFVEETDGFAVDLGFNYFYSKQLMFGIAINHLGGMSTLNEKSITLPLTAGIGSRYNYAIDDLKSILGISLEAHHNMNDNKLHISFGFEPVYNDLLFLRLGYITGFETKGFTTGLGIKYNLFEVNYAYTPFSLDLGNSHSLSIGFIF